MISKKKNPTKFIIYKIYCQENSTTNMATHADFLEGLPLGVGVGTFEWGGWGGGAPYP